MHWAHVSWSIWPLIREQLPKKGRGTDAVTGEPKLPIDDGHGPADLLNLILECTGQKKKDKEAKVTTAQMLWIPAVNGHGEFGRWAFFEVRDPWNAKTEIRAALKRKTL